MKQTLLIIALSVGAASGALAQVRTADPARRGVGLAEFPRIITLAPNVYGYEEIRQPGFTTVSMFVVGRNGVLLADGQGSAAATQTLLDHIRTVTPLPVKWYVVGSDHGDHTAGNSVLPKDIRYIVHPTSRAQLARDSTSAAASGGRAGQPPRVVIVPPVAMTGLSETVDLGGITVEVRFLGRAHTGGDLMVHVPDAKILFMSEAYLNRVFPAMRSAYPDDWVEVVDRALMMPIDRYVPGHGFIEAPAVSREELKAFREALVAVTAEARRLHGLRLSPEDAVKAANWGEYRDWFLAEQQAPIAIRRVFDMLEGRVPSR
jgi:glyoxylase-like metal-dependent hydrolase (beta-lactamase superfamily II)